MTVPAPILADADNWLKLLPLAIPVLLWLIVSVAEAVKRASNQTRRPRPTEQRRPQMQAPRPATRRPMPPPRPAPGSRAPVPPMRVPTTMRMPPPPVPSPRRPAPPRPPKRIAPPRVRPAEELEAILEPEPTRTMASTAPVTEPPRRPQSTGATALQLHRWMRPQTLQSQFILTEILQSPVSLREPRGWE